MTQQLSLQEIDATAGEIVESMGAIEAFAYAKQLQKVAEVIEALTKDEVRQAALDNGDLHIGPLKIIYTKGREKLDFTGVPEYEDANEEVTFAKEQLTSLIADLKKKGLGQKIVGQPGVMTKWAKDA